MARHPGIVVRALTWNLFHGRDAPPGPGLRTWRSRLLRVTETGATHAQVNRSLREEFAAVLAAQRCDLALLQEAPPRWLRPLGRRLGAHGVSALTSRNWLPGARSWLAERNPDLIASGEGGSNQLLVRPPWRIDASERVTIARWPERRRMLLARVVRPGAPALAVANLHASTGEGPGQAHEVERAAERACEWAGQLPLLFGGDLNLRPARAPELFARLSDRHGLRPATGPAAIDHLLARGLEPLEGPRALRAEEREVEGPHGLALRLSDHAPVVAAFGMR